MVEAAGNDRIWGIGVGMENKEVVNQPSEWKGLNLLGEALMKVRGIMATRGT